MNLILAAGNQDRWNKGNDTVYKVKQLILINGEILIRRTQRQFPGHVVTHNEWIILHCDKVIRPEKYRWIIETMHSTSKHWQGQTRILLGDVYYTDQAVKTIYDYEGGLRFFGNKSEIFAISFNNYEFVRHNLERVIERCSLGHTYEYHGRLWLLYRRCHGIDLNNHSIRDNFTFIEDDTQDFDFISDYNEYISK